MSGAHRDKHVLVIGNCTIDIAFTVPRFPRPGETLLASARTVALGGKGANQAIVARRAGMATTLAVPLGNDGDGDWAVQQLVEEGLPDDGFLQTTAPSDQSILYVTPDGENCIVSSHAAAACATPAWAEATVAAARSESILLIQGNLSLETTLAALATARGRGMLTIINPAPIQYAYDTLLPLADVVIANQVECAEIGGDPDPIRAVAAMRRKGARDIVVTLGAGGARISTADGDITVPAPAVDAIDTVGAGDVFCGIFTACLARDSDYARAAAAAVSAAALSVTRRGTLSAFPSAQECASILARHGFTT